MPEQPTDEQMQALQEKIKNMSPEELKEFQKKQCIFCQIIAGKVQSKKIYEDESTIGILDINPSNPGHILLLPKEHYTIMPQVPEDEIGHIFMVAKALSNALLRGIGAKGTNIIVANGVAAGQRAQHFMVHVIPRMEKDGLNFVLPQKTLSEKDLDEISKKLSSSLGVVNEQESQAPPLFQKPEKEVVEAEFDDDSESEKFSEQESKEEKAAKNELKEQKKPGKNKKEPISDKLDDKTQEEQEPKEEKDEGDKKDDEIDLDDIANLLGAK